MSIDVLGTTKLRRSVEEEITIRVAAIWDVNWNRMRKVATIQIGLWERGVHEGNGQLPVKIVTKTFDNVEKFERFDRIVERVTNRMDEILGE